MVKDLCFEVIEKCTNNCKFCSSNSDCNKTQIIDFNTFKRVIDYFVKTGGIEELSLSGGEPLLHPNIIDMVKYAKSLGIRTVIFTSGVVFGKSLSQSDTDYLIEEMNRKLNEIESLEPDNELLKENIRKYYQRLIEQPKFSSIDRSILRELYNSGLDKIVFDMQAYESETDNYLMGRKKQSHQALLKSLIDASFENLNIDIHFVPMKPNYREIKELLELIEIAGVQQISFLNFIPQGRGKINSQNLKLTDEERMEFFKILDDSRSLYSGKIRIGIPFNGEETHRCNAGLEKLDIKFDGTVLPCPAFKELTQEECEKFNIKLPNIYTNLEDVHISGTGKRINQLCKQVYSSRRN